MIHQHQTTCDFAAPPASIGTVPVSVFIITLNEQDRIADAIDSCFEWADEIVVVDSGSTDRTREIAEALGARVVVRDFDG